MAGRSVGPVVDTRAVAQDAKATGPSGGAHVTSFQIGSRLGLAWFLRWWLWQRGWVLAGDSDPAHRPQLPVILAPFDGRSSSLPRVNDRDLSPRQALAELGLGSLHGREFRICYNDDARLDGVEQCVADGFILHRQAGDQNVGAQVRCSFQQRVLAGTPQVREQQNPLPADDRRQHQRIVIRLGEAVTRFRMQHGPGAQLVVAADRPQLLRRGAVVFENPPVNRRAEPGGADAEMLHGKEASYQLRATDMTHVAVSKEQGRQAVDTP